MKEAPIHIERFEAIEAYLLGTLSLTQREEFERELAQDAALREELEMQREHTLAVEMAGLERLLKSVAAEEGQAGPGAPGRGWGWLRYAAMLALLALGAAWWLGRPDPNEQLFAQYHVPDPGLPVPMSAVKDFAFQDAMVAYKLGDLDEALAKWGSLLQQEPTNDTLLYYIGQAELQSGNAPMAVQSMRAVLRDSVSVFHDKARWYLFLAYLKLDDREAMKAMKLEEDSVYGERVRAVEAGLDR